MYISGNELEKIIFRNLIVSIVVLIFGAVYEYFSFGVYSLYMVYSFAVFLIMGVLLFAVVLHFRNEVRFRKSGLSLYHFGLTTITIGCIVKGILEIYGTTNSLVRFYWIAGAALVIVGVVMATERDIFHGQHI